MSALPDARGWVIFLDVDGVLLPVPRFSFGGGELDRGCVCRLQRLITDVLQGEEDFPVTIILSSTWRNFPDMIARLNFFLQRHAGGLIPPVSGGTPKETVLTTTVTYYADHPSEQRLVRDRVDEIYAWLHEHVEDYPEAIGGRWFAIDDMQLDVDERMKGHFLKTVTEDGLTSDDVDKAKAMVAQLPSPGEAQARAIAARNDPQLMHEKVEIERVLRLRVEEELTGLRQTTGEQSEALKRLSDELRECRRSETEWKRRHEDVSYRLAVLEFSQRISSLQAAVRLASHKSGSERREIDKRIRSYVQLLRHKKELEKKLRTKKKKEQQQQQQEQEPEDEKEGEEQKAQ